MPCVNGHTSYKDVICMTVKAQGSREWAEVYSNKENRAAVYYGNKACINPN